MGGGGGEALGGLWFLGVFSVFDTVFFLFLVLFFIVWALIIVVAMVDMVSQEITLFLYFLPFREISRIGPWTDIVHNVLILRPQVTAALIFILISTIHLCDSLLGKS